MTVFRADWILPIRGEPLREAWLAIDHGRITGVGVGPPDSTAGEHAVDLGRVALLPGLVNAHTHLELSYLHRVIPPATEFTDWIREVMRLRRGHPDPGDAEISEAAAGAIRSARAAGTALIADVSNTLVTGPLLAAASMPAVLLYELLGFSGIDAEGVVARAREQIQALPRWPDVRVSLAAHAPYPVSPALFAAIRADLDRQPDRTSSVHLGESPEELDLLRSGQGRCRALLEELGAWNEGWQAPDASPVEYLEQLGFLDRSVLAVHGVQFTGQDLERLHALDVTIVSCPRSNRYVGVGSPPLEVFYAFNVPVAFGTDSLASAGDLNIFNELAEARRIAPRVPSRLLLEGATRIGARALGFDHELGTIEVGKRAALIAVRVPSGVTDVEEYLVSGIEPADITWL